MKKGRYRPLKENSKNYGSARSKVQGARHRAVSIFTAAALIITPFGSMAFAPDGFAFGDGTAHPPQAKTDPLASYPDAVRGLVESYQDATMTADELTDALRLLEQEGVISLTDLDELLLLLEGGAFDPVSDPGDDENGGGAAPGDSGDTGGSDDGSADDGADGSSGSDGQEGDGGAPAGDSVPDGSSSTDNSASPDGASDKGASSPEFPSPVAPGVTYPSSGTYIPHHYSHNLTTEKFIATIGEQARQIGQERDLYASVMIAQAILESASGNSALAQAPNNNLFGIKGTCKGKSASMLTQEDDGTGLYYTITARFRAYDSITDSLEDYAGLMAGGLGGFYQGAWKSNAETPSQACDFLEGRYATSTSYSESLQDLIETYDLTRFDKPLDYELVESYEFPVVDEETGEPVLDEQGTPVVEQRTLADLIAEATTYLDTDYVWGASVPDVGFDCSGLVQYSYREALGIELPRTSYEQWKVGETVDFEDLHAGDLLFFEKGDAVYHVAMYLGDGYYIHAPQKGDVVKVTSMDEFMPSFAQRIVETRPVEAEPAVEEVPVTVEPVLEKSREPRERHDPFARLMTPFVAEQVKGSRFFECANTNFDFTEVSPTEKHALISVMFKMTMKS